jgi:hypothetical protein
MVISGDVFRINQVYELIQEGQWPNDVVLYVAIKNHGWFGGGYTSGPLSTVDRITFASDTGTATARGPLSLARYDLAATGNNDYGWFVGGGYLSTRVDRITFADDTGTASVRGPLSIARSGVAATAGII